MELRIDKGIDCKSSSHQIFKTKAKNRLDDLQGIFSDLRSANKQSRAEDVLVLEEQVHQMLREWKAELDELTPQNSSQERAAADSFPETLRMLNLSVLDDDSTSKMEELMFGDAQKPEQVGLSQPDPGIAQDAENNLSVDDYLNYDFSGKEFLYAEHYENNLVGNKGVYQYENNLPSHGAVNCLDGTHSDYQPYNFHQERAPDHYYPALHIEEDDFFFMSDMQATRPPSPAAFLGPKCALWDCPRPSQKTEDYCSSFHASLAFEEGQPNKTSVVRPGGIDVKDGLLFVALTVQAQGKDVGIPMCEGAATSKSPWNATDLFPPAMEGELCREWLFFDKPRKAFDCGNRKQRSLPDHIGRGWHESRKIKTDELKDVSKKILNSEFRGSRRSYYMDPQPIKEYEWHLYEYELANVKNFALYRLEYKIVDPKKLTKIKTASDPPVDQQQMRRVGSGSSAEKKKSIKARAKASQHVVIENT